MNEILFLQRSNTYTPLYRKRTTSKNEIKYISCMTIEQLLVVVGVLDQWDESVDVDID